MPANNGHEKIKYLPVGLTGNQVRGITGSNKNFRLVIEIRKARDRKTGATIFLTTDHRNGGFERPATKAEIFHFRRVKPSEKKEERSQPKFPTYRRRENAEKIHPLDRSPKQRLRRMSTRPL